MQAESDRIVIPALPRLRQRRTHAWVVSLAAHAVALGLLALILERAVVAPPLEPVRMVFVEPAPPPPPPLGGQTGAVSAPVMPEPVVEKPMEIRQPQRLVVPQKAKPKPRPAGPVVVAPRGDAQGEVDGVVGGVVGGEAGGKVGGVVGGHGDAPIPGDQVEHPPVPTTRVLPVYPPAARARNLEGRVVLRAVVDRDGRVEQAITVVESIPMLDTAAVDALRQWRFTPGRDRDGHTVRVLIDLPIRFQLR
jgi:periplasmic protein TonB